MVFESKDVVRKLKKVRTDPDSIYLYLRALHVTRGTVAERHLQRQFLAVRNQRRRADHKPAKNCCPVPAKKNVELLSRQRDGGSATRGTQTQSRRIKCVRCRRRQY